MKAYLAGPDVFRSDANDFGSVLKTLCAERGIEGLFPLDSETKASSSANELSLSIFKGNVEMIDKADAVIANIMPFRGSGMDPGTAWEIGYALAKGKAVFLYSESASFSYFKRTQALVSDGHVYLGEFTCVEDFNLTENLMVVHSAYDKKVHHLFAGALNACAKLLKKEIL
jgi:nucleoside 2-deoxyribosyltransferase